MDLASHSPSNSAEEPGHPAARQQMDNRRTCFTLFKDCQGLGHLHLDIAAGHTLDAILEHPPYEGALSLFKEMAIGLEDIWLGVHSREPRHLPA